MLHERDWWGAADIARYARDAHGALVRPRDVSDAVYSGEISRDGFQMVGNRWLIPAARVPQVVETVLKRIGVRRRQDVCAGA